MVSSGLKQFHYCLEKQTLVYAANLNRICDLFKFFSNVLYA